MDNKITSISEIQIAIKAALEKNSYFAVHGVPILIENAKDIEYQIKSAMGSLGIVATVSTPSLTYAGIYKGRPNEIEHGSDFPYWTINTGNIVIVENPTLNRGRANYATALDTALQAALTIQQVPNICDASITQTTSGGLVVVNVQFKTNLTFALERVADQL